MQHAKGTASGPVVPVSVENSFAVTQATWRFFANERVTALALVEPLRQFARDQLAKVNFNINTNDSANVVANINAHDGVNVDVGVDATVNRNADANAADSIADGRITANATTNYALAVVDWSKLDYKKHTAKHDIVQLTHQRDIGYELTTQLLVDTRNGQPIAPIQMHLKTANGYLSTMSPDAAPPADLHHLEQVLPMMHAAAAMRLPAKLVHVIDREADSVFHLRAWYAAGFSFLVRGNDRIVQWRGEPVKYETIEAQLEAEGAFRRSRNVTIKGKPGVQFVAETEIVCDRPAKRKIAVDKSVLIPGDAIVLRLVIVKVVDPATHKVLSTWYLLTNVSSDVSAETIALWYF